MGLFDKFKRKSAADSESGAPGNAAAEPETELDDTELDDTELDDAAEADIDDPDLGSVADDDADAADEEPSAVVEDEESFAKSAPLDRLAAGPFDVTEVDDELNRIDLGGVRVPVRNGMQVRLEVEEKTQRVLAVTIVHDKSTLQLQAFAAPRSEGLWNTVRSQIAETVTKQKGQYSELHTSIGRELIVKVPATLPDGRVGLRHSRYAGVDGPRWFLRAVFGGKALTDDEARNSMVELFRGVVVNRGDEPMAPRDLIPITPPKSKQSEDDAGAADDDPDPFARGPEITEVR